MYVIHICQHDIHLSCMSVTDLSQFNVFEYFPKKGIDDQHIQEFRKRANTF